MRFPAGLLALGGLLAAGCAGPASMQGAGRRAAPIRPAVLTVEGPIARYDVRGMADLQGLEARVYALVVAVASRAGRPVPSTDAAASTTARQIARGLLPSGPPPSTLVEFAMRSNGLVDPPPHLVVAEAPGTGAGKLLDQLGARLERILRESTYRRVGIGVGEPARAPGERRLVLALFESRVHFSPLPRELRLGQHVRLEFEVVSAHQHVHLVIAEPAGQIASAQPAAVAKRYASALSCSRRGIYQVEVTGDGPFGTEVLANFPVYCDERAPREVRYGAAPPQAATEEDLEREVFRLTNQVRQRAGLPSLRYNRAVAEVARRHSEDMRAEQFVGHVSPRTGSPGDRLRRAHIVHLSARENVARAYSPAEAVAELQKSPAHRVNLLATDVDEIGVGVAIDRSGPSPVLLVTQNFIRAGTLFDPAAGAAPAYKIVDERRRALGLPALRREPELEKLAARYLHDGALGSAADQRRADAELSASLRALGGRFGQVEGVLVKVPVLEGLARAQDLGKRGPTHLGLAVAGQAGEPAVFLLLATPR